MSFDYYQKEVYNLSGLYDQQLKLTERKTDNERQKVFIKPRGKEWNSCNKKAKGKYGYGIKLYHMELGKFSGNKKKGFCCLAAEEGLLLKPKAEDHLPFHNKKGN